MTKPEPELMQLARLGPRDWNNLPDRFELIVDDRDAAFACPQKMAHLFQLWQGAKAQLIAHGYTIIESNDRMRGKRMAVCVRRE